MTRPDVEVEVAVLGAGPAGSIAARELARAGVLTCLIDPGRTVTGHGIESFPASGAALANDIGLLTPLCAASDGPAGGMQMVWRDTPEARQYDGDGPLLLHRAQVHAALRDLAGETPNCTTRITRVRDVRPLGPGMVVTGDDGPLTCNLVIDARGRAVNADAQTDLMALPLSGISAPPQDPFMHIEALADGWIWACCLSDGAVTGAIFQSARALAGTSAQDRQVYADQCLKSTSLPQMDQVTLARPCPAGLAVAEDPLPGRRHILIGDAALARDPISSHGLVHAMRSAVQGAIVARTILAPDGDAGAAESFLRQKHHEAVRAARAATAQAYLDQTRHRTPFWSASQKPEPLPAMPDIRSGPVELAFPLTRAPVLDHDRIRWTPALETGLKGDVVTHFGPLNAVDIAAACRPPAPLPEIASRLGARHPLPQVFEALEHLAQRGVFVQARRSV